MLHDVSVAMLRASPCGNGVSERPDGRCTQHSGTVPGDRRWKMCSWPMHSRCEIVGVPHDPRTEARPRRDRKAIDPVRPVRSSFRQRELEPGQVEIGNAEH